MSPRDQANYIFNQIVTASLTFLAIEFQEIMSPIEKEQRGISERSPRWKECLLIVSKAYDKLSVAVGAMYVRAFVSPDDKTAAEDIVKNLKTEFTKMLTEADWMDPKTRAEAKKKMLKMTSTVAYPKEFLDNDLITHFYSDLKMKDNDSYLLKSFAVLNFMKRKKAADFRLY